MRIAQQCFHFPNITGTLKIEYIFENLQKPSLYINEQSAKKKFKNLNFIKYFLYFPKKGKTVFCPNNSKWLQKIKECITPCCRIQKRLKN